MLPEPASPPETQERLLNLGFLVVLVAVLGPVLALRWPAAPQSVTGATDTTVALKREPIQPIPVHIDLDPQKVELGRRLFLDPGLSKDGTISCHSCHDLSTGGDDNTALSTSLDGALGKVNTPTVFNASLNFRQLWDGRAATLEEQVGGPLTLGEMGDDWDNVTTYLSGDAHYRDAFLLVYGSAPTSEAVRDAIAEFERSLLTPNARFDLYLRGDTHALSDNEREGYQLFKQYGCISCHQGRGVGGNMYQTFGVLGNYFRARGNITEADYGLYNQTGREEDRYVFKVPSLRNVAVTAPYFHDGTAETLEDAIRVMGTYQVGVDLSEDEIARIADFLRTLTGEYRGTSL